MLHNLKIIDMIKNSMNTFFTDLHVVDFVLNVLGNLTFLCERGTDILNAINLSIKWEETGAVYFFHTTSFTTKSQKWCFDQPEYISMNHNFTLTLSFMNINAGSTHYR